MRILTNEGRRLYREAVIELADSPRAAEFEHLLENTETSLSWEIDVPVPEVGVCTKYELASRILPLIEALETSSIDRDLWPCIWDTLALRFFGLICPRTPGGQWKPNRLEHYCLNPGFRLLHRHRIYGPVTLVRNGGRALEAFMGTPPSTLGDFEEQIGSRNELAGNRRVFDLLNRLYISPESGAPKRGYTSVRKIGNRAKKYPVSGSLRRFVTIHLQLSRTYDLFGMDADRILDLLPAEFDRWKGQ